jgi:DNA invertase Pin-like site-specific DNA recombinase
MKAMGYIRVSTQGQAEEGVSLDAQEAKIRAWAEANGAAAVQIFRDEGISGKRSDNRPGLQAALEAVGPGDALIAYSLSRLSRSTRDTLDISEKLQKRGADLVSLTEKIDTTSAAGKMVFRLLAVLAEFERDQISDRTKSALAYKKSNGEKTGGDVPFGFKARGGRLYQNAKEQAAVRLIAEQRRAGASLREICRALEAGGYRRKNGGRTWDPRIVADILIREASPEGSQKGAQA